MRLVHARRTDDGRFEIRNPTRGSSAARILAQQIVYHLTQRDSRQRDATSQDPDSSYRASLRQRGIIGSHDFYNMQPRAYLRRYGGVEQ
jgi:hypothetical protein